MKFASEASWTAYRMHTPKWAIAPTSGAGAALHGGRANRPGMAALYLALDEQTAIDEFRGLSSLLPPGTLVTYQVIVNPVLDFRSGYAHTVWPPEWSEFYCNWRTLWFGQRIEPPSWALADQAVAAGAKGILFESTVRSGGTNLVLYTDRLAAADSVRIHDPARSLPTNQKSWI